jgi:hypothetical protein
MTLIIKQKSLLTKINVFGSNPYPNTQGRTWTENTGGAKKNQYY